MMASCTGLRDYDPNRPKLEREKNQEAFFYIMLSGKIYRGYDTLCGLIRRINFCMNEKWAIVQAVTCRRE
jgi:hypothetical protein